MDFLHGGVVRRRRSRAACLAVISGLLVACRQPLEVRGLYVSDGQGALVSCDEQQTLLLVSDSALAESYRHIATQPHQWLFVRLRGVTETHGSIYGGSHHLLVQQILDIPPARPGGGGRRGGARALERASS